MSVQATKSGWLHRRTSVLKRWKKNWFVVYSNGTFKYFDRPDNISPEDSSYLPSQLYAIKTGRDVIGVTPPLHQSIDNLMSFDIRNTRWIVCADSFEEVIAWKSAVDQCRSDEIKRLKDMKAANESADAGQGTTATYQTSTGYPAVNYPRSNVPISYGTHPPSYVVPGNTIVLYDTDPFFYDLWPFYYRRPLIWGPYRWW